MKCNKNFMGRRFIRFILVNVMIFFSYFNANAQEMPPRPSSVFLVQNMSFGAFTLTGPGHVYISPNGTRTWDGQVFLVNMGFLWYPAIFGLKGNLGTIMHPVIIVVDPALSGSNGGSMPLTPGNTSPPDPIIINVAPPGTMQVFVGGTLTVGQIGFNPPGFYYGGIFEIAFSQE